MRQADQEGALVLRAVQQVGPLRELDENVLEQIAGVALITGEVQQKSEQRLGVVIVQPFKLEVSRHRSITNDASGWLICLEPLNR